MTLKARITAIDRFIKGCREDGIYDNLNACCVMAGWDSLAGALTPLKGAAPTNNGLSNYDRGIGITGDGSSKYLDSNRASNADGQDNAHMSAFISTFDTRFNTVSPGIYLGAAKAGQASRFDIGPYASILYANNRCASQAVAGANPSATGLIGTSRPSPSEYSVRCSGSDFPQEVASVAPGTEDVFVLCRNSVGTPSSFSDATIAFYSIGSATDLAALDARVSTLMADLRAIEETGFDRDAIAYIRAVEEADGAYLETDVKIAVNNLVSGLKADGLWDAIGSSCLLCGPRTLAGALVPLRGAAPTAYGGWASGDYDRATGLTGDPTASLYLDSNRANDADPQDDKHVAVYVKIPTDLDSLLFPLGTSSNGSTPGVTQLLVNGLSDNAIARINGVSNVQLPYTYNQFSLFGASRPDSETLNLRVSGSETSDASDFQTPGADPILLFGVGSGFLGGEIAYYSIGSHVDDLAALESHISAYVTAIGAAL